MKNIKIDLRVCEVEKCSAEAEATTLKSIVQLCWDHWRGLKEGDTLNLRASATEPKSTLRLEKESK